MDRPLCCHCHAEPVTRPRGLGYVCYYTPGVRDLYPSTSKFAPANGGQQLPRCSRCGCLSGHTARDFVRYGGVCTTCKRPEPERSLRHARLAVYEQRAAARQPLFTEAA